MDAASTSIAVAIPSHAPPPQTTLRDQSADEPLRPTREALGGEPRERESDGGGPAPAGSSDAWRTRRLRRRPGKRARVSSTGAVADQVASALARVSHAGPIFLKESPESTRRRTAVIVARFDARAGARLDHGELVEPLVASLESRALEVRRLETVSTELPSNLGEAFRRILRTAALSATTLGFLGALACSMLLSGEALVPSVGWIPGPIIGAAIGAGVFGAAGFVLGALAMLLFPAIALRRAPSGTVFVIVRARAFDLEAIIARIVDAGGTIAAVGDG